MFRKKELFPPFLVFSGYPQPDGQTVAETLTAGLNSPLVKAVVHLLALATVGDDLSFSQNGQVPAYSRLGQADRLGYLVDCHFLT